MSSLVLLPDGLFSSMRSVATRATSSTSNCDGLPRAAGAQSPRADRPDVGRERALAGRDLALVGRERAESGRGRPSGVACRGGGVTWRHRLMRGSPLSASGTGGVAYPTDLRGISSGGGSEGGRGMTASCIGCGIWAADTGASVRWWRRSARRRSTNPLAREDRKASRV